MKEKKYPIALNNRIFLIKDKPINKKGNLFLVKKEGMYAPPYSGVIISVGSNVKDIELKKGIRITFHDIAGVEFLFKDNLIFSIRETDVTSIIGNDVIIE